MAKLSKRALALLLASMLVVSAVGCKKNDGKDKTTPTPVPTGTEDPGNQGGGRRIREEKPAASMSGI